MLNISVGDYDKRLMRYAVFIPLVIVIVMIMSCLLEWGMGWDFHALGVYPRRIDHFWGVLSIAFVHSSLQHLFNNAISFFVLSTTLYFFYKQIASKVLLLSYLLSSILLWIIGRDSWHIGASGWVYALVFFLFFSGVIRKYVPLIAISLVVVFLYGSLLWHVFPWQDNDPVSWEGHLSGAVVGSLLAVVFRHDGPQNVPHSWDDDENDADESNTDYEGDSDSLLAEEEKELKN